MTGSGDPAVICRDECQGGAWRGRRRGVALAGLLLVLLALPFRAQAQVSAALTGIVSDASGLAVPAVSVTAKDVETAATRSTMTDALGSYQLPGLAVGEYEVTVAKDGFQSIVRGGIHLVVGQSARLDFRLVVGEVRQQVTVTGDVSPVGATTTDVSGLVGEEQIKDLPLNGRSYDLLTLLNPGVVNFTWEKTGGAGISNSTTANDFSVSGNRPQQNLFLLNGVEYSGAAENNMTPGGASGQLLGVDSVREFDLLREGYGAEYGKKPGGQVSIVTQSGSNQWHGTAFEFVRNSALDARNFFDPPDAPAPPFARNQFGASIGGPVKKDKTFVFSNYEGFRQNLEQTSVALVPDAQSRLDAAPIVKTLGLLNLWPVAPPGSPDFPVFGPDGVAQINGTAPQQIREDFGTVRVDHIISKADSVDAIYTIDDSNSTTATPVNPYSTDLLSLREQVLSAQETHVFSPTLLNTVTFGYTRAGYFFTGEPTPGTPATTVAPFLNGVPFVGAVVVGGSQGSNPQAQIGLAGSNNGSSLHIHRTLLTFTDDVAFTKGRHQFKAGIWLQPFQSNEELALSQYGQMTFTGLPNFIAGKGTFLYDPTPSPMSWRSVFGAWYAEDVIRLRSNLTVSLGFRAESSSGWNEANGLASNYTFNSAGVIVCTPTTINGCAPTSIGGSVFTVNRAKFLPQPRASLAWSPFRKTVVRAAFGMYNDLQDALGYRTDQNSPFNPTFNIGSAGNPPSIATYLSTPIQPGVPPPSGALLVPGGVQPDLYTPTVISYSLTVVQELSPNTSLSVAYVGNHGYHEIVGADANAPVPDICGTAMNGSCPTNFPNSPGYGALANQPVPVGTYYTPSSTKPNPLINNTWTYFSEGTSNYNALQIDFNRRFSKGFALRGVYTWSKTLDDGDSLNATAANNAPGLISNPYNIHADWGLATFDVRNAAAVSVVYALPVGRGQRWLGSTGGVAGKLISGWNLASIIHVQSGFPFTPQLSYNPANNGDSRNPVRPFLNPDFTGPVVTGNPNQWFNPNAFIAFPSNSGFYGNVGRDTYTGPGLATWDFSTFKETRLSERFELEFRAEIFNLLNRANFNTPNLIAFVLQPSPSTLSEPSGSAGQITSTSTTSRQVQFGLKLRW